MNIITKYEPYSGTLFGDKEEDRSRKSIFVSIVCYRDDNIFSTILSLLNNAKRPENIFISVALAEFQADSHGWVINFINFCDERKNNIKLSIVDCNKNTTFGQLKKLADSQYNKEDYYLSVAPRSEFDPYWDDIVIKQYQDLNNNFDNDVVITVDPRKYLPHDEVVDGFVYFTNHKVKTSMQREEYDGSRVPVSGYTEFTTTNNIEFDGSNTILNYDQHIFLSEKNEVEVNNNFLLENKFVKFSSRKFTKNEYLAVALGFCSRFVFTEAKKYFKYNSSNDSLVDQIQFDFYSFINFIRNKVSLVSIRFTPVYYLYEDGSTIVKPEKTPKTLYDDEEYKNSDGAQLIYRLLENYVYRDNIFNTLLSIDWQEKVFKQRSLFVKDSFVDSVNSFISLYNFSTYENSLHWNKKC